MQKTSFQATDATTQSSNQEENERIFFFFISLQNTQQGKMMTRSKPRELKENSGLKRRSRTESEHEMQKQSRKH
jgi:hypothetical protein